MRIDRVQPQMLRLDIHPMELAALVTAARWVVTSHRDELPPEAVEQLDRVLADYDRQAAHLGRSTSAPHPPQAVEKTSTGSRTSVSRS